MPSRYAKQSERIVLAYNSRINGGEWEAVKLPIYFERTPYHYGGYHKWFLCPQCGKRIAVVYGAGHYFLCRHCHNLTYASQQKRSADRMMRKARNIRRRLGGDDIKNNILTQGAHFALHRPTKFLTSP